VPLEKIESEFNAAFDSWDIRLPPEDIEHRRRGEILKGGWSIRYLFGSDERGEYLDYYSVHRMTNDSHVRIYADGQIESLPAFVEFRFASSDPKEDARLEAEYRAENERISKLLKDKGFED